MISRQLTADIEVCKAEQRRLADRRKTLENKKTRLLKALEEAMRLTGKTKFKTALFSFGIQKNGGKQPLVLDVDPAALPQEFQVPQPPKADDDAIRAYIDKHGSASFAHLEPRGESLRIR